VEKLDLLAVALGLATLAGVNLYLTVFATGLAIHFHWITLAPQYQSLEVLGNPWIISIAGVLYLLEFFADKIPWVDSIWDAVHTVIRPIGGALLAIQVLGHPSPAFTVIVALLAGGTSLLTHTAKAATRLASNTSPEPISNIGLSLGEDAAVLGGLTLIHFAPLLALIVFLIAIGVFFAIPVFSALLLSLTDFDIYALADLNNVRFIGLQNYERLFANPLFWGAMRNTGLFAVLGVPLSIAASRWRLRCCDA